MDRLKEEIVRLEQERTNLHEILTNRNFTVGATEVNEIISIYCLNLINYYKLCG